MSGELVLATAGHVDHGKTALVLALTGLDTDRLPEEKARGISIALGFAPLALPSGRSLGLVDVPGHERFVRHMVAGASGVDGYLLCVAADDGVMPQTREHLAVLGLLGVEHGVVAITKCDLIEPDLATEEVRELVGDQVEIVPVCVRDGRGLPELGEALERLAARLDRRTADGRSRLFVDRAFSVAGAGTVVTGTLWGAPVAVGERMRIEPGAVEARVRSAQRHEQAVEVAEGGRVALNLAGTQRDDVERGSCLVRADDEWRPTELLDVRLRLTGAATTMRSRRRLQAFLGTAEIGATVVLIDAASLEPGGEAYAQLRLDRPVPAAVGDRLVLRSAERRTVGGAVVLDPSPARHGRSAGVAARLAALDRGDLVEALRLAIRDAGPTGLPAGEDDHSALAAAGAILLPTGVALPAADVAGAKARAREAVADGPVPVATVSAATGLRGAAADGVVALLVADGEIVRDGGRLAPPQAVADPADAALAGLLASHGLSPPGVAELAADAGLDAATLASALARLRADGAVVQGGDLWFDAAAAAEAREVARDALAAGPLPIGALRDAWGVGRRHALALAAYLDASGLTRRQGELRALRRGAAG